MDNIFGKVGTMVVGHKANKELDTVGNEINTLTNSIDGGAKWLVNKIKGKVQKPLPELLKENGLPEGLFPREVSNYEFNEQTKLLTVTLPSICEVGYKDSSLLRFATEVTGYLEKGKITNIDGMKTKVMFLWVKVSTINSEGSNLHFMAGMKRTRSKDAYEVLQTGVTVQKF